MECSLWLNKLKNRTDNIGKMRLRKTQNNNLLCTNDSVIGLSLKNIPQSKKYMSFQNSIAQHYTAGMNHSV